VCQQVPMPLPVDARELVTQTLTAVMVRHLSAVGGADTGRRAASHLAAQLLAGAIDDTVVSSGASEGKAAEVFWHRQGEAPIALLRTTVRLQSEDRSGVGDLLVRLADLVVCDYDGGIDWYRALHNPASAPYAAFVYRLVRRAPCFRERRRGWSNLSIPDYAVLSLTIGELCRQAGSDPQLVMEDLGTEIDHQSPVADAANLLQAAVRWTLFPRRPLEAGVSHQARVGQALIDRGILSWPLLARIGTESAVDRP
jgi:hypothetical protein